jgi:hypothetical protein
MNTICIHKDGRTQEYMQESITRKNQDHAGDDNFYQTYFYANETRN